MALGNPVVFPAKTSRRLCRPSLSRWLPTECEPSALHTKTTSSPVRLLQLASIDRSPHLFVHMCKTIDVDVKYILVFIVGHVVVMVSFHVVLTPNVTNFLRLISVV